MRTLGSFLLFASFAVACGGSTTSPTGSTNGTPTAGSGGASAGSGGASAGSAGTSGGAGGTSAAGTGGNAGESGGSSAAGTGGGGVGGGGGVAGSGAGGSSNACFAMDGSVPSTPFKTCTNASDCVVAKHTTDCCGSIQEVGIAASEASAFQACESAWDMHFPPCGCASNQDQAEDGMQVGPGDTVGVACTDFTSGGGICKTFVQHGAGGAGGGGGAGGAGGGCQGAIEVSVDDGPLQTWTSICSGSWGTGQSTTAVGYEFSGGPAPGIMRLVIDGCVSADPNAQGVTLMADDANAPGSYSMGGATYVDGSGTSWGVAGDPMTLEVTKLDDVGGVIEGSFKAQVTHGGNAAHLLAGSFHVCRVSDELAPLRVAATAPKKLTTLRLAAATYFLVAGGPYGLEELVQAGGFSGAALAIVVTPVLFSLPTALMVGELAAAIPEEGGYYAWVKRALGPGWGFVEAWLSLSASFFDMAIYPTLFVTYLARVVPALDGGLPRAIAGAAMIAVCSAWNVRGARSVGNASVVFSIALLAPFAVLSALAAIGVDLPSARVEPSGSSLGVGAGLLVAMWNFMGWDNASTFAGEVERPQRTYPLAMGIAVAAVALTYLVPILAASKTSLPPAEWSTGAWVVVGERVGGPGLALALVLGGVICGVGMFDALLLSYSRIPAALAADGLLPRVFARENARGVPVVSVVVCSVLYSAGLFLSFRKLLEIDLAFYGVSLLLEFVALVVLRLREPTLERPFRVPGGTLGAALLGVGPIALFAIGLVTTLADGESHGVGVASAGASFVVGLGMWAMRRKGGVEG